MLDVVLKFLKDEVNAWLSSRTGTTSTAVDLSRIIDENGKYGFAEDSVALSLIGYEEERVLRAQTPEYVYTGGQHVLMQPELCLNLTVMFASNHRLYDQALKYISYILVYFQAQASFSRESHPALDERIERIVVEVQSLTYEQQNQVWAFLGGKMLPNAIYKVRMVPMRDTAPTGVQPPIFGIRTEVHGR